MISQTASYALRATAHLSTLEVGERARVADISPRTDIPSHYLSKVMRMLVVAEICDSRRGHHGGFALARPAEHITFLDVLRAVGEEPTPNDCVFGYGTCGSEDPCPLHHQWSQIMQSFRSAASVATIATLNPAIQDPSAVVDALVEQRDVSTTDHAVD